jgi:molybdopterin-containing oxidoreductase family membrane subunit
VDVAIYIGTLGIFMTLFLLFARAFPVIAIAEVKSIYSISSAEARKHQLEKHKKFEEDYKESFGAEYAKKDVYDTNY